MAASMKTPLWKRLLIISAVVAGMVVASVIMQAGVSALAAVTAGAAATLIAMWVVAKLLHVRLAKGWE